MEGSKRWKERHLQHCLKRTHIRGAVSYTHLDVYKRQDIHIIRNQTTAQLEESIRQLEQKIRSSQIIMIPGGFSGGDEPDGSAKFITAVFRNPGISDAVSDLLENRDGLMLGICNGFQALIKLGLVPEGKIVDGTENSPTLTYNKIGRHASCLVRTGITSVKSPWLAGVNVGDVFTIPCLLYTSPESQLF